MMNNLSKEQYKLLKKINKFQQIKDTDINSSDKEIILSLLPTELVEINWLFDAQPFIEKECLFLMIHSSEYKITQAGKAYIQSAKKSTIKWCIPTIISLIALLVSILK